MKKLLFLNLFIYLVSCNSQNKNRQLHFPQVNWTLTIPENSNLLSPSQIDSIQNETSRKTDKYARLDKDEVIFVMRQGESNFFAASLSPFDSAKFDSRESSYDYNKKNTINLISSDKSIIIIDTNSSVENIDGVPFQRFYIKTKYPEKNIVRDNYWYYRKQDKFDFSINVSYSDSVIGDNYLAVLRASKFEK